MNLLTLVNIALDPKEKYDELKNKLEKIKTEKDKLMKKIKTEKDKLMNIRDSFQKFHKIVKEKQIQEINKINEIFESGTFSDYELIDKKTLLEEEELVKKINNVKDSEIFYFTQKIKKLNKIKDLKMHI